MMKKTIAAVALLASSKAMALAPMLDPSKPTPKYQTVCMSTYQDSDGSLSVGCDEARNNVSEKRKLLKNGCAAEQAALWVIEGQSPVESCMPAGMVQL